MNIISTSIITCPNCGFQKDEAIYMEIFGDKRDVNYSN
jgi:hypothetical protein